FHNAAGHVPILHIKIAILVPVRTMGAAEYTFDPLRLGYVVITAFLRIRISAEGGDDFVFAVDDGEFAHEVGDGNVFTLNGDGGRLAKAGDDFADEFAIKRVMYKAA